MARSFAVVALAATLGACTVAEPLPETMALTTPVSLQSTLKPGYELIIEELTLAPGQEISYHVHPGEEIITVLSGEAWIELESVGHVQMCAGDTRQVVAGTGHAGRGGDAGAELLVTRIHPIGQPIRVPHASEVPPPIPDRDRSSENCR